MSQQVSTRSPQARVLGRRARRGSHHDDPLDNEPVATADRAPTNWRERLAAGDRIGTTNESCSSLILPVGGGSPFIKADAPS
jgi:hypothetical protein